MGGHFNPADDGLSKERIVTRRGAWVADFVTAVANDDAQAVDRLFHKLRPKPGVDAQAALLILADIAGRVNPRLVANATGCPFGLKGAPREKEVAA
jgi:hypothetical protein